MTNTTSTRYLVEDYGFPTVFDSIEEVREAANELWVWNGEGDEEELKAEYVEEFVASAKPITEETLELTLEDDDEEGLTTHRPFRVTVEYAGEHRDQDWERLYDFVRDEWVGESAHYNYSFLKL